MCGIFGIINTVPSGSRNKLIEKSIEDLFELSESRGKESAGMALKSSANQNVRILKDSLPAQKFISLEQFKKSLRNELSLAVNENGRKSDKVIDNGYYFTGIAHTRLVTNGSCIPENNQPVKKFGYTVVHNGIIVNIDELWRRFSDLERLYEVDSEFIPTFFGKYTNNGNTVQNLIDKLFNNIYGETSFGLLNDFNNNLLLATNSGSIYYIMDASKTLFVFASEKYILERFKENIKFHFDDIMRLNPGNYILIDFSGSQIKLQEESIHLHNGINLTSKSDGTKDIKVAIATEFDDAKLLEFKAEEIFSLKRCSKCLLPETFPFIVFDDAGTCNYCINYKKINLSGIDNLDKIADKLRSKDGSPDCLVAFSGGRDSSYGLHFIKKELNLNPIAYTYDWGMVTDLARRNQSRLCGKLNIEHIVISADINRKRDNIRKNVSAWLKRPNLGTVPLFMAGDKQYFYYANQLGKFNNLEHIILCENMLETTNFKSGFCGIEPNFGTEHTYTLSLNQKFRLFSFYLKEFVLGPSFINTSLVDTFNAFLSYYFLSHNYLNLYDFIKWDETKVENTLIDNYDWELSPDTESTWRIGDGTAAFYNYIYFTVAGFSEIETFRSNQIREGMITRDEAFELIKKENYPRYESIKWYCDTINIDFRGAISTINKIPKTYGS